MTIYIHTPRNITVNETNYHKRYIDIQLTNVQSKAKVKHELSSVRAT